LYIGLYNDTCPQHVDNGTAAGSFYQILEISATRYAAYRGAGRSRRHITEVRSENWSDPPISAPTRAGLASRGLWSINSHHAHDATRQHSRQCFSSGAKTPHNGQQADFGVRSPSCTTRAFLPRAMETTYRKKTRTRHAVIPGD